MTWPRVSVIVPCYNEIDLIEQKVKNLCDQDYRGLLEVLFVDGGSPDGTYEKVWRLRGLYRLNSLTFEMDAQQTTKGKTHQLNYGIKAARGDIILVTDVDAIMEKNCITKLVHELLDPEVAVVGACSVPDKPAFLDPLMWWISNFLRMGQANRITAPWVIATCYAFRRGLIEKFPDDVVADDCYIALKANFDGFRTVYTGKTVVREIRNPTGWGDFLYHKLRKANALLREFSRFSYRMAYARPGWKCLFIFWFIFLVIVAGWAYPYFKQDSCFKKVGEEVAQNGALERR